MFNFLFITCFCFLIAFIYYVGESIKDEIKELDFLSYCINKRNGDDI